MNTRSLRQFLFAGLIVAWLFVVVFSYYVVHKPFNVETALALLSVGGDIILLLLLLLAAAAVGFRVSRALAFATPLERIVLSIGLGWAALSFSVYGLGLVGLLYRPIFWSALIGLPVLMRRDLVDVLQCVRSIHLPLDSRFKRLLALFVSLTVFLALIRALTPPLAWDAQVYHLSEGKYWIASGRIGSPPDIPNFSFPSFVEMLYLSALLLKGDTLAQIIHWSFLLLTIGLVLAFGQRYFSQRVGLLAAAILSAVPSFVLVSSWAYVDSALAFYTTAGLYCVLRWNEGKPYDRVPQDGKEDFNGDEGNITAWLILAGAFAGIALGIKYTALVVPIALIAVIVVNDYKHDTLKKFVLFAAPTALLSAPWYLRNLIVQGNPIYPFIFGGRFWDPFRAFEFSKFGTGFFGDPLRLLIAPWEATIAGQEGALGYQATIGPLLLVLIPFSLFALDRSNRYSRFCVLFCAIIYAFWLIGVAESRELANARLLFPAFPTAALAAAIGFESLSRFELPRFSLGRFGDLAIGVVLALSLLGQGVELASLNPLPFLTGLESRDDFLSRRLAPNGYYEAMQSLARLPSTSKVLFLWEPRSYYATGTAVIVADAALDRFGDLRFRFGEPKAIAAALRDEGYTHILLGRAGLNYYLTTTYNPITSDEVVALQQLLSGDFTLVSGRKGVDLAAKVSIEDTDSSAYSLYEMLNPGDGK